MLDILDRVITIKSTPRIERLREDLLSLKPTGSLDRALIETRIMKETEGEPPAAAGAEPGLQQLRE